MHAPSERCNRRVKSQGGVEGACDGSLGVVRLGVGIVYRTLQYSSGNCHKSSVSSQASRQPPGCSTDAAVVDAREVR
jgi:hypothetical protein